MYDLINFVETKFGLTYLQAVDRIHSDVSKMKVVIPVTKTTEELVFDFTPDDIKNSEHYWNEYKLPINVVAKYCFLAKSVYRNETFWGRSTRLNPIFVYKFISGHMKLYRPMAPKTKKWAGNADCKDVGGFFQLQKRGVICFVTSSIKDVMVLRQHGFPAICFNGETYGTSENGDASKVVDMYFKILKSRFKYICLFLDHDSAGISSSAILGRKHRVPFVTTGSSEKDISDFQKKYGVYKTYRLVKKLIRSQFKNKENVPF